MLPNYVMLFPKILGSLYHFIALWPALFVIYFIPTLLSSHNVKKPNKNLLVMFGGICVDIYINIIFREILVSCLNLTKSSPGLPRTTCVFMAN